MAKRIKVTVYRRKNRDVFECKWKDPVTGRYKNRSTGEKTRRAADKFAGSLEKGINDGTLDDQSRISWADFRDQFETEKMPEYAEGTQEKMAIVLDAVETHVSPAHVSSLGRDEIRKLKKTWRQNGLAQTTIKGYLGYLQWALSWAKKQEMIREVPDLDMPKGTETMKGRPTTREEVDRMIDKLPGEPDVVASWRRLIEGLWWSGLRLGEAMRLTWDDDETIRIVDIDVDHPVMMFQAGSHKGRRFELCPMAPEFVEFLRQTPVSERRGFVFSPMNLRDGGRPKSDTAGLLIANMGRQAGVKVGEKNGKTVWGSAQSMRRAFGTRWSRLIKTADLQKIMRHKSITTTMTFYVEHDAASVAAGMWDAIGDKFGDSAEVDGAFQTGRDAKTL